MVLNLIYRLIGKKGQTSIEETPAEKGLSVFLLILIIVLIVLFFYLIYRFIISGQLGEIIRFFRYR